MNNARKITLAAALVLCSATGAVNGQGPGLRPLTESELTKKIDSFGLGDPLKKSPLSVSDPLEKEQPKKEKEPKGADKKKGANQTEITAQEATFDQKSHQAVFTKNVLVVNPEFNLVCEKLTTYMKHDGATGIPGSAKAAPSAKPAGATPAPATPAPTTKGKRNPGQKSGGLEKAIAEGSVVITQEKPDSDGALTRNVGRSKRAVYDAGTGDITLTGRPEVSQGINTCISLDEGTIIILNQDGHMKVIGPHKTVIKDSGPDPSNAR